MLYNEKLYVLLCNDVFICKTKNIRCVNMGKIRFSVHSLFASLTEHERINMHKTVRDVQKKAFLKRLRPKTALLYQKNEEKDNYLIRFNSLKKFLSSMFTKQPGGSIAWDHFVTQNHSFSFFIKNSKTKVIFIIIH
jgi:hypothetical protein